MPRRPRRNHSSVSKARVAFEALGEEQPVSTTVDRQGEEWED